MTTADYLTQLQTDKSTLVSNLTSKGITGLTGNETFTELVPKVLDIQSGGNSSFTGHYDATGLASIGWDSTTIDFYQNNAVTWNQSEDSIYALTSADLSGINDTTARFLPASSTVTNFSSYRVLMGLPALNISSVTNGSYLFSNCWSLMAVPLINTSGLTDSSYMFNYCYNLRTIASINLSHVTNASYMFNYCYNLEKVPNLDLSSVTSVNRMFYFCYGLKEVGNLDTRNCTNFGEMFRDCRALKNLPYIDTRSATSLTYMFNNSIYFYKADFQNYVTTTVTDMSGMFSGCYMRELDISSFVTPVLTNVSYMFNNCYNLRKIDMRNMTFGSVTNWNNMFGTNQNSGPPNNCLVIVKDATEKSLITSNNTRLNNVKTVAEYEGS